MNVHLVHRRPRATAAAQTERAEPRGGVPVVAKRVKRIAWNHARRALLGSTASMAMPLALTAGMLIAAPPAAAQPVGGTGGQSGFVNSVGGDGGTPDNPDGGDGTPAGSGAGGGGGGPGNSGGTGTTGGGGVGGNGATGTINMGAGGDGGDGGANGFVGVSLPGVAAAGNHGEAGKNGIDGYSIGGGGGGGGAGGYGAVVNAGANPTDLLTNNVTGGDGGAGGEGGEGVWNFGGDGGNGGGGGWGLSYSSSGATSQLTIGGGVAVQGGNGGNGGGAGDGTGNIGGDGGTGGNGGAGLYHSSSAAASQIIIDSNAAVRGGDGGNGGVGGNGPTNFGGSGGDGGNGGIGIAIGATGATIINSGVIAGGDGGVGGAGGVGSTPTKTGGDGADGAGGAGIAGSGLTVINSGMITGGLGGDGVTRANAITFTGGTNRLEVRAGSVITGTVDATAGSASTFALGGSTNNVFDVGQIGDTAQYRGFQSFEKTGTGVWTLTGVTTSVTPWTIKEGTLSVFTDASLGDASGGLTFEGGALAVTAGFATGRAVTLAGDGEFDIAAATTLHLAGPVTGAGTLIKTGDGTLRLTGTNMYGGTSVQAGTLIGDAGSISGSLGVAAGATAIFDQSADAVFAGAISGAGAFVKDGAGSLQLTGDGSGFTGATTISDGVLLVQGRLGGSLTAAAGATLGGSGTVGTTTVATGGTLAPGGIGTLTVDGDLVFETGSRFAVEVDPQGSASDLVKVTGTATLNGGSVVHIGANGRYDPQSTYRILTADGVLTGAFDEVTSDFAFLTPGLVYDYANGTIDLELARNDVGLRDRASTRNQVATADGIDSLGMGHAVHDAVVTLPDDESLIRASLDRLSGEIHASVQTALVEDGRFLRDAATARLRAAFEDIGSALSPAMADDPNGGAPAVATMDRFGVWGTAFGSRGHRDSDGNAGRLERSTGGVLLGVDGEAFDGWRFGVLAGYSRTSFDGEGRDSSGASDNYHLGLYGGTRWGGLGFRSGLAYTWHDIETSRSITVPGLADDVEADYWAGTFQTFGELGHRLDAGVAAFEPFAGLAHVRLSTDGYGETGGPASLQGDDRQADSTFTTLGLRTTADFSVGAAAATARGMLGWRHAFGDTLPLATHAIAGGDAFTVAGAPIAEDVAVVEAGLDLKLAPGTTLGLAYSGQVGSGAQDHGVRARLGVRF